MPSRLTVSPTRILSRLAPPLRLLPLLAAAAGLAGCGVVGPSSSRLSGGAVFRPQNFSDAGPLAPSIRRVALLPVHAAEWRPSDLAPLESAFAGELGKVERFELVPVSRSDLVSRFGTEAFLSSASLPGEFLQRLRDDFGADAVLFIDLTHYSPYQPIALGVRAKLVATADATPLWSFDAVFDSARPDVAEAARRYHRQKDRQPFPLEDAAGILQSPARFTKYVASAMFGTLPPRQTR